MDDEPGDGPAVALRERTEKQIREDELALKRDELTWKKAHESKLWRSPVVLAGAVATLGLIGSVASLGLQTYLNRNDPNPVALVSVEQKALLDLIAMPDRTTRDRILCEYWRNGSYQTVAVTDRLNNFVDTNNLCAPASPDTNPPDTPTTDLSCVVQSYAAQACRAYDKSGFHSKPRGSCTFNLTPAEGFVFDTNSVEFIEHVTRRIDGADVRTAVQPTLVATGSPYATSYGGTIRCTNDSGTGRTCEYNATVRVGQVPAACARPKT